MALLPLRDARPRVRGLPDLPRLLPAGLPRDHRPDDRAAWSAGIDILFFRPDDEVRKLARLAIELGLADAILAHDDPEARARRRSPSARGGGRWLAALEEAKEPWFWFSTGAGLLAHSTAPGSTTCACPSTPCAATSRSSRRARRSSGRSRRSEAERERISAEYRELLGRRRRPRRLRAACASWPAPSTRSSRTTTSTSSTGTTRSSGTGCASSARSSSARGFLDDARGHLLPAPLRGPRRALRPLHRLGDGRRPRAARATGRGRSPAQARSWTRCASGRRRRRSASPPEEITEPFTVMLFGITTDTVDTGSATGGDDDGELRGDRGLARASPRARRA